MSDEVERLRQAFQNPDMAPARHQRAMHNLKNEWSELFDAISYTLYPDFDAGDIVLDDEEPTGEDFYQLGITEERERIFDILRGPLVSSLIISNLERDESDDRRTVARDLVHDLIFFLIPQRQEASI